MKYIATCLFINDFGKKLNVKVRLDTDLVDEKLEELAICKAYETIQGQGIATIALGDEGYAFEKIIGIKKLK